MLLPVSIYVLNQICWTRVRIRWQNRLKASLFSPADMWNLDIVKGRVRDGTSLHRELQQISADCGFLWRWSYLIGFKCRIDARLCRCVTRRDLLLMDSDEFYHAVSPRVCVVQLRGCGVKCVPGNSGFITVLCSYICARSCWNTVNLETDCKASHMQSLTMERFIDP